MNATRECSDCGFVTDDAELRGECDETGGEHDWLYPQCCLCYRTLSPPRHLPLCQWCGATAREAGRLAVNAARYPDPEERL